MSNPSSVNPSFHPDELPGPYQLAVETILSEPVPEIDVTRLVPKVTTAAIERRSRRNWLLRVGGWSLAGAAALALGSLAIHWNSSLALAQVVAAASARKNVRCTLETFAEVKFKWRADGDEEFVPAQSQDVAYFDLISPRIRIEREGMTANDAVKSRWVTVRDNLNDRVLVTSSLELAIDETQASDENQAALIRGIKNSGDLGQRARLFRITGRDDRHQPFPYLKTEMTFLEIIRSIQGRRDVDTAPVVLNGRNAMKYQLVEYGKTTVLWIDPETKLPLRIEQEVQNPNANMRVMKWIYTDFEWDRAIKDPNQFFSTDPPEGYAFEDHLLDK